jgi:moderate conductance mechanosensitive channel
MTALLRQVPADGAARRAPLVRWDELIDLELLLLGVLKAIIVLVLAFVAYRVVRVLIVRTFEREIEESDPLLKRTREQRMRTLASLLSNIAGVFIFVIAILTALRQFLEIGPVLASVGVLGLAFSFGAQSLVKDIISGTFLLLEGQFGVGDIVRVGDVAGMVEKITIRITILRDAHGVVHIIPNGEINRVSNLTKNWSRAVLDIGVAYRENVDRVMDVMRAVGDELRADPEWGPLLMEPPEVLGVDDFASSAVVIRLSAKTLPLKQWLVARELRRRIKNRFDLEKIEIPFPHVTFYWGDGQVPALPSGDGARDGAASALPARDAR